MKTKLQLLGILMLTFLFAKSTTITISTGTDLVLQATSYYNIYNNITTIIAPGTGFQVYNYLYANVSPGDTLFIDATTISNGIYSRNPLQFKGIKGELNRPVIIKNKPNKIVQITQASSGSSYGLSFHYCENIKVSGLENEVQFMLKIKNFMSTASAGISIDRASKNFEIDNIEVANVGSQGIQFKSAEPYNGSKTVIDTAYFRQYVNAATLGKGLFHHNYIHNVGSEGFYIGSTAYDVGDGIALTIDTTFAASLPSNGILTKINGTWRFLPHLADTILVYNNITDSTGWDGIQVACAKNYKVYNNQVNNWGRSKTYNQMYGIIIGSPCIGEVFNNTIKVGNGSAIQCFGVQNRFYNNLIIRPNLDSKENTWWAINAMYLSDKSCTPQVLARLGLTYSQTLFEAAHNTLILDKNDSGRAIFFFNVFANQTVSKCYNNLAIRDPKPDTLNIPSVAIANPVFIANPQQANFSVANNFTGTDIQTIGFIDAANGNYDLMPSCVPCRNAQALTQAASDAIYWDLNNNSRLTDQITNATIPYPSFGCYETESSNFLIKLNSMANNINIATFPNPINGNEIENLVLELINNGVVKTEENFKIQLVDLMGKAYIFSLINTNGGNNYKLELKQINCLSAGIYFGSIMQQNKVIGNLKLLVKQD